METIGNTYSWDGVGGPQERLGLSGQQQCCQVQPFTSQTLNSRTRPENPLVEQNHTITPKKTEPLTRKARTLQT